MAVPHYVQRTSTSHYTSVTTSKTRGLSSPVSSSSDESSTKRESKDISNLAEKENREANSYMFHARGLVKRESSDAYETVTPAQEYINQYRASRVPSARADEFSDTATLSSTTSTLRHLEEEREPTNARIRFRQSRYDALEPLVCPFSVLSVRNSSHVALVA